MAEVRHGYTCSCCAPRGRGRRPVGGGNRGRQSEKFEGKDIKVVVGSTGRRERLEFYYGGWMYPDGPGHGHVVCNDGETINYWRLPSHEGGRTLIDDRMSTEKFASHMF